MTEKCVLLKGLEQYSEYCFQIDAFPDVSGGYWSQPVEYCATTGLRGKRVCFVYHSVYRSRWRRPTICLFIKFLVEVEGRTRSC